jgi:hypothetical protein
MTRPLALLAALALTACGPQVARLSGNVGPDMASEMVRHHADTFRLPHRGGYTTSAIGIAVMANQRGQTLIVDGPLVSASVLVSRLVHRVHVVDPNAAWFGLHYVDRNGTIRLDRSREVYRDMRAPGCFDWYSAQPEARVNGIVYVSWNFLERDCR